MIMCEKAVTPPGVMRYGVFNPASGLGSSYARRPSSPDPIQTYEFAVTSRAGISVRQHPFGEFARVQQATGSVARAAGLLTESRRK